MRITSLASTFLVVTLFACGGGDSGGDPDGTPGPDASPADAGPPTATGNTAKGAMAGADQIAFGIAADAKLYRIASDRLIMGGAEINPTSLQSFWSFHYLSVGTGVVIDVIYAQGEYGYSMRTENPEGKRVFSTDWIDSDVAVDTLTQVGYAAPPDGDPDWRVGMTLEMYGGIDPDLQMIAEPIWRCNKVYAPPGMTPLGEEWWVTYWSAMGGYLYCDPMGSCGIL